VSSAEYTVIVSYADSFVEFSLPLATLDRAVIGGVYETFRGSLWISIIATSGSALDFTASRGSARLDSRGPRSEGPMGPKGPRVLAFLLRGSHRGEADERDHHSR